MRPLLLLGMAVVGVLAIPKVGEVKPLSNTEEFLMGTFRMPAKAPVEGPIPDRLNALSRDQCALPKGTWLRFQNFGADRYKDWSAQMQIDDQGNIYLVTHLGDATSDNATPDKVKKPAWPAKPQQKLDTATLAELRKAAAAFAAGPAYRGHEGLSYAPTFVVTVYLDSGDKEIILEGFENDFISHLRRITSFAHATPLGSKAAKPKSPAPKQPARKP